MKRLGLNPLVGHAHHLRRVKDSHSKISTSNRLMERMGPTPAVTWRGTTLLARNFNSDSSMHLTDTISSASKCPRAMRLDVAEEIGLYAKRCVRSWGGHSPLLALLSYERHVRKRRNQERRI